MITQASRNLFRSIVEMKRHLDKLREQGLINLEDDYLPFAILRLSPDVPRGKYYCCTKHPEHMFHVEINSDDYLELQELAVAELELIPFPSHEELAILIRSVRDVLWLRQEKKER